MALTATATPTIRDSVIASLKMSEPVLIQTGFDRGNLFLDCKYIELIRNRPSPSRLALVPDLGVSKVKICEDIYYSIILKNHLLSKTGLIYVHSRKDAEQFSAFFQRAFGLSVEPYHAGLTREAKNSTQEHWEKGHTDIIVATSAFGMGVDVSGVRFVAHAFIPNSLCNLYQEIGRAGRDGEDALVMLYYSANMLSTHRQHAFNDAVKRAGDKQSAEHDARYLEILEELRDVKLYAEPVKCRRQVILEYFEGAKGGQDGGRVFERRERCCDVCASTQAIDKMRTLYASLRRAKKTKHAF